MAWVYLSLLATVALLISSNLLKLPPMFVAILWLVLALLAFLAVFRLHSERNGPVLFTLTGFLLLVAIAKLLGEWRPEITSRVDQGPKHETLYVLVHGMSYFPWSHPDRAWEGGICRLKQDGDVLTIRYPGHVLSNADPDKVASEIETQIANAFEKHRYKKVIPIGFSMGALFVRKAFLNAPDDPNSWAKKVDRIVLLAGMNRGWDVSGNRPLDMSMGTYLQLVVGSWFGEFTGTTGLVRSTEMGHPFVADLRLEWMRRFRNDPSAPHVVQLLGDIDDVVNPADNMDLRVTGANKSIWLKLRGTGHGDAIQFDDPELGEYRKTKFEQAVFDPVKDLEKNNEEQALGTNPGVTELVFVLHGIRDLGEWSTAFEQQLKLMTGDGVQLPENRRIASIRYGYFGMGPFILMPGRQKYVRWFMDQYTETLARYPNVQEKDIHFFGHSNGTYLFASSLKQYRSLRVNRVVFANSVVPRAYDWATPFEQGQVGKIRNLVAPDDWVVALFPRCFEAIPIRYLGNDLGSAGFNGFEFATKDGGVLKQDRAKNVGFVFGQHSAFVNQIGPISEFLTGAQNELKPTDATPMNEGTRPFRWLEILSDWGFWIVWLILIVALVWLGAHAVGSARQYGLLVAIVYTLFVIYLLNKL